MSEMVERVARAIHAAAHLSFNSDWDKLTYREGYYAAARAAIEAMREPTFDPEAVSYHRGMTRADWWRAMIEAALAE